MIASVDHCPWHLLVGPTEEVRTYAGERETADRNDKDSERLGNQKELKHVLLCECLGETGFDQKTG